MALLGYRAVAAVALLCLMGAPARAQDPGASTNILPPQIDNERLGPFAPDPPEGVCPPSGYAPPKYGISPSDDGVRPFEIASPCNSQEVRDAAEALGMNRFRPAGLKMLSTIRFTANGFLAAPLGEGPMTQLHAHMDFFNDALRLEIMGPGAPIVHVVDDGAAWEEAKPGVGFSPSPAGMAADRTAILKLTPFGALRSIIEAEGHATVTKVGGKMVMTGASPYDGIPVTITFNADKQPEMVKVVAFKHVYTAAFSGYTTKWEPGYYFIFPEKMVWTKDGKPLADLTVTEYKSNPYVVFPKPEFIKSAAK